MMKESRLIPEVVRFHILLIKMRVITVQKQLIVKGGWEISKMFIPLGMQMRQIIAILTGAIIWGGLVDSDTTATVQ